MTDIREEFARIAERRRKPPISASNIGYNCALDEMIAELRALPSVCGGEDAREALRSCESTLQLCSERIASDRVAMDQIAAAIQKENASPNFKKAMAGQDKIDKYVFLAIDQSRALAQGVLASPPPVSAREESILNAIAAMERVHVELAALVPEPANAVAADWPCENPADREALQTAYEINADALAALKREVG